MEFQALDRTYAWIDGAAVANPAAKADIFSSTTLKLGEKNILMRFVKGLLGAGEDSAPEGSFAEYLRARRFTPRLVELVMYALAGVPTADEASAAAGIARVKAYVASMGRFGATPFVFAMYGVSEFCQAFCRLAAVHGATYMLAEGVAAAAEGEVALASGRRVKTTHVVASAGFNGSAVVQDDGVYPDASCARVCCC